MRELVQIARIEIVAILALLYGAIAFGMLAGRINLTGLLDRKQGGGLDPARVQGLVATLFVAASLVLGLGDAGRSHAVSLPSAWLLAVLGGSHGFYLQRKHNQGKRAHEGRDH